MREKGEGEKKRSRPNASFVRKKKRKRKEAEKTEALFSIEKGPRSPLRTGASGKKKGVPFYRERGKKEKKKKGGHQAPMQKKQPPSGARKKKIYSQQQPLIIIEKKVVKLETVLSCFLEGGACSPFLPPGITYRKKEESTP